MGELSRKSSRLALSLDDTTSITSFPDPAAEDDHHKDEPHYAPLHGLLDSGPSMFDDNTTLDTTDPQTLSVASNAVIRDVIDHHGATEIVRRLSTMLAQRDAHITALTRLAEEYKIPREHISDAASRAKQAERRRASLANASEDLEPPLAADSASSKSRSSGSRTGVAVPPKGITKLFGGAGKTKPPPTPTKKSRNASRPRRGSDRPRSVDVQSVRSADSVGWTTSINGLFSTSLSKRDSRDARVPVEMETRHDKDQLPPTLSHHSDDPQEAEWNKFILKLVELRQQNGEDLDGGELIGASHFGQEGSAGRNKLETLTRLVAGGIPMKLRHPLWMELSHTQSMMQPNTYEYYLGLSANEDASEIDAILKDVPRTLTSKYDFYSGKGFERLKDLLLAFVAKYPDLGYTQGLNTIAGYLLLAIPSEEDAFWLLCNIVENFFPAGYFSREDAMVSPLADNTVLRQYVKELTPQLDQHLDKLGIQPGHTVPMKWFFTAYSSALPEELLMRLWDVWLCLPSQKQFLFPIALALLAQNTEGIMKCEDSSSFFSYMDGNLKLPEGSTQLADFIKYAYKIGQRIGKSTAARRADEVEKTRASTHLESRLRRRRTQSLEVLVDREDAPTAPP